MSAPGWLGLVLKSPFTALLVTLVMSALALTGHSSAAGAGLLLFAAWCVAVYGLRTQPVRVWLGSSAFLFLFLCLLAYWFRPDVVPAYSGILVPRSELLFSPSGKGKIPLVQIGKSDVVLGPQGTPGVHPIKLDPRGALLLPGLEASKFTVETINGEIKFSCRVLDADGKMIAEITRNEWKVVPPPGTFDRNYSDDALEVIDPHGRVVLQVVVLSDRIQIQGAWPLGPEWKPSGAAWVTIRQDPTQRTQAQISFLPINPKEWPEIKPMFEYPSERHLGEIRKQ